MKTLKKFILNGMIMTCTSLFLRLIGIMFNTYVSNRLGSEGMGVYTLVQSVFGFAITFSCSGINLGTTRLVSEALANECWGDVKASLRKCIMYALSFSFVAMLFLFCGADFVGNKILGDKRTVKAVRILAICLPFISLSTVFNGYFSAVRRAYKSALVFIFEQFIQVFLIVRLLGVFALKNVEYACVVVALGTLVSESLSMLYNLILCFVDFRKNATDLKGGSKCLTRKLLKISIPLALSTYVRSGLLTVEHLLIPYGLRKNGSSYSVAMSTYGVVQGMVFPIIMFPSCIIYSFSGLLVPELAALNERCEFEKINKAISNVIYYSLFFSIGVSGIMLCYAYELSMVFYNSAEAYEYIRLFAPLIVVMYLDGAIDGILKGLNEQLHSMKINIADALISVLLVYFLVPYLGVKGYIIAIFVCEIFNCTMSLMRLVKISQPQISVISFIFKPIVAILISTWCVVFVFELLNITVFGAEINLSLRIVVTVLLYMFLLFCERKRISVFCLGAKKLKKHS